MDRGPRGELMPMPSWWLFVSTVFLVVATVAFAALIFLLIRLMRVVDDLQPRIRKLTERVDGMAEKLEGAASSAKAAVDSVGAGTRQIVGSVEGAVTGSSARLDKLTAVLVTVLTVLRMYRELVGPKK